MMGEQRFQRGWMGREDRLEGHGVFQRRELVGMQSHRALRSALNTSISVCREQNKAITG